MGFPRQEYWSGCHPGDIPDPGIELASPTLVDDFFYHWAIREAHTYYKLGHLYFPTDSRQESKASMVSWSCREYEFPSLHKSLNQKGSRPLILSLSLLCTEWLRVLFISAVISLDYMSMKSSSFNLQVWIVPTFRNPTSLPGSSLCGESPAKSTGVDFHYLLLGIFLIQGSNHCLKRLLHWQTGSLPLAPPLCHCCVLCHWRILSISGVYSSF